MADQDLQNQVTLLQEQMRRHKHDNFESAFTIDHVSSTTAPGTVTMVSVVNANGISATVANPATTPAITLILGNITPGRVIASGQVVSTQSTTTTTLDWNNGNVQYIQLANGSQAFTFANPQSGGRYMLMLKQPNSGAAGTVTWPAINWIGNTAPTLTAVNNKVDIITFVYDGSNNKYYGNYSVNY